MAPRFDLMTILTLGERILALSTSAWLVFKQATQDAGAGDEILDRLDAQYQARIDREQRLVDDGA